MSNIVHTLTNRRWMEKAVAYAESHDQVRGRFINIYKKNKMQDNLDLKFSDIFAGISWR